MREVYLADTKLDRKVELRILPVAGCKVLVGCYAVAPELDDLRSDQRFKEMLKRLNLPE